MENLLHIFPLPSDAMENADPKQDALKTVLSSRDLCTQESLLLISTVSQWRLPLLFQCALTYASEGKRVLFILKKPLDKIPNSVHGMARPEASVVKNMKFVYYSSIRDLISFCANVHTQALPPEAIIVDDLEHYVQQSKDTSPEQTVTKLCCLLIDAASFIQQKSGAHVPLVLAINDKIKSLSGITWRFPLQTAVISGPSTENSKYCLKMSVNKHTLECTYEIESSRGLVLSAVHVTSGDQPLQPT